MILGVMHEQDLEHRNNSRCRHSIRPSSRSKAVTIVAGALVKSYR